MYIPPRWRTAAPLVTLLLAALTGGLFLAFRHGSVAWAALTGGALVGLFTSLAWALRHFRPELSLGLCLLAVLPATALALLDPNAFTGGVVIAAVMLAGWLLIYDLGVTGRASVERPTEVTSLGGDGSAGQALIVYHSAQGGFQPVLQRALAEGLQDQGWRVDITTASGITPVNLSRYQLLVLGAPAHNWRPARPVLRYLERIGNLWGIPVVLVVSGGGMTDQALKALRGKVTSIHGQVVGEAEVWTTRSNLERHASADPAEIMRNLGAQLRLPASAAGEPSR